MQLDLVLSIFAWGALAYALSRLLRGGPSLLIFAGTLAVGLSTPSHAWDLFIRAESSSHSVLLLTLACLVQFCLSLTKGPIESLVWATVTAICAFFCANARDTNGYFLLLLVGVVASALIDDYATSGPLVAWPGLFSGLAGLVGAGAVLRKGYRGRVLGLFVLALVLGAISQLYVCYHADAMEVNRHSVIVGLLLRLSVVASAALLLSWVLELSKRLFVLIGGSSAPSPTVEPQQQRSSTATDSASVATH